jgi:hypothetical protein
MEPEFNKRMVAEGKASTLSLLGPPPTITVNVYELEGAEVSPEKGLAGMHEWKMDLPCSS